jgi:hypothetical protein
VAFDNGRTFGAMTLNETAYIERETGTLLANGLVSLFNDGRWSTQGLLSGSRYSAPMAPRGALGRMFQDLRGELALSAAATAQQGLMPTLQLTGESRVHFSSARYAARVGAGVARTFDGIGWRTTVMGELGGWWRATERTAWGLTTRPMQLQFGDLLGDTEGTFSWVRGRTQWETALGVRLGEAAREDVVWGSVTVSWPLAGGMFLTTSAGSYPVDLIQGLPGGSFGAVGIRLPNGRFSWRRQPVPVVPVAPRRPERPELPTTEPLALVIGEALDSTNIREIRVWAPGIREVELMADFVDWIPVPLIRQPNGEWQGYYRVPPGLHRLNLRLDRAEVAVPRNLARVRDDFSGEAGVVIVR